MSSFSHWSSHGYLGHNMAAPPGNKMASAQTKSGHVVNQLPEGQHFLSGGGYTTIREISNKNKPKEKEE